MSGLAIWSRAQLRCRDVMAPEIAKSVVHSGRYATWGPHPFSTPAAPHCHDGTVHMIQHWRRTSPAAASATRDCDIFWSRISSAFQRMSATDSTELAAAARWVGGARMVGRGFAVPSRATFPLRLSIEVITALSLANYPAPRPQLCFKMCAALRWQRLSLCCFW
jgi:hypothetical protein